MKKMMKTWALVAVAVMGLTACQNDIDEQIEVKDSVVVTFVADSAESRTSVDTSGEAPVFSWDEEESFTVLEQTSALAKATDVVFTKDEDGKAQIDATFTTNNGQGEYNYVTIHPAAGFDVEKSNSITSATLYLPENQYMYEVGTYDSEADLMVSEVVDTDAQPTEAKYVSFTRLGAVVKMTLKGFTLGADEVIEKVIFTADGKNLAGNISVDLYDPHNFTAVEDEVSSSVTVLTNSSTNKATDIYFVTLPTVLAAGDTYTVTVITSTKIYMKNGSIPAEKELKLGVGAVNRFGVDMSSATVSGKWVLVKDASTLAEGDVVAIVAKDYDKALSTKLYNDADEDSTTAKRDAADVSKLGNCLIDNEEIQRLVLVTGTVENTFGFYDEARDKFLVSNTKNSTYLINQVYCNENTSFAITIDAGTTATTITNTAGTYLGNLLRYNNNGYFTSNQNDTNIYKDVCIYELAGASSEIPTVDANVTVPQESVVIAEAGAETATAIESVVFNYVGDWTISASAKVKDSDDVADWLTLTYADGKLSYTATANEGEVRYATVSITATLEGNTITIGTFNVLQKGSVPTKVSIAEFRTKEINDNVVYQITGKLTKLDLAKANYSELTDPNGNIAKVRYISYGEEWLVDKNVVQLGDVVTVNTTVTTTKYSGGSSSIPSEYVGHYRLTATPETSTMGYTGGELTIDVATLKNGDVEVPATISGNMTTESEGITFSYEGGDKATMTFTQNDAEDIRLATVTFTSGEASVELEIMQDVNPNLTDGKWCLVTDASTLAEGDLVIIAAQDYDYALGTTLSSNRRKGVEVTKSGNYLTEPSESVQQFVLINGSVDGTFAFYDDVNKGFLVSTGTSKYLYNQPYYDNESSFAISIENGTTKIGNKAGDYPTNIMNYYSSSNYFYSATSTDKAICLYKLMGATGEIPVVDANVTVPASTSPVVIETDGTAPAEDNVVFNYVGDWTISATSSESWLTVSYADGKLSYNAEANEGEKREAVVTISATRSGVTKEIGSFNVIQRSAPIEVTLADFMTKGKDVYTTYKFTGRVKTISSSSDGTYAITDGTKTATVKYLYTEDGKEVYDNNILAVGDIVTVYTVVTSSTLGTGGSSTYHSTYIGHYNFTAVADSTDPVSYEGGSVTISIATTGNLQPEGVDITGSVTAGGEFATLSYTPDATSATLTFDANNGYPREATVTFSYGIMTEPISITIAQNNHPSVAWYLVTDVNELQVNDKVIIVALDSDYAVGVVSSTSTNTHPAKAITKGDGKIQSVSTDVQQYVLEKGSVDNTWAFKGTLEKEYYIYSSSSTYDYLKIRSSINSNASWSVAIDSTTGAATLTSNYTSRILQYNSTDGDFDAQKEENVTGAVCIYKYDQRQ